jgi:hypothetical protein
MRHSRLGATVVGAMLSLSVLGAPAALSADETPTNVYLKYHNVLVKATTLDSIKPFMSKDLLGKMSSAPRDETSGALVTMQQMTPTVLHVDSERIDGNLAQLKLSGKLVRTSKKNPSLKRTFNSTGEIEMVRENGNWRIKHQDWDASADNLAAPR